jgi:Protein of unknown function (DUF2637)/Winged helix-turn-helix DNA-binding
MDRMGRHNHPNGHRGDDGAMATLEPLAIHPEFPMERFRPLTMPWAPPRQEEPVSMDKTRRSFDGDRLRRASMWVLAAGVAAIAAIVSYSHIYDLGRAHGGSGVAARLLPLSVDMLILVGELMLLHEADAKGRRFVLGWVLVWSGILATLAANVTYGAAYGVAGAVIWGWPAYSFILAAGGMVAVVKRGAVRDGDHAEADTGRAPLADKTADRTMDRKPDIRPDISMDKPQVARARKTVTAQDRAADMMRRNPGLSNAEIAKRLKVSEKTVSRARTAIGAP